MKIMVVEDDPQLRLIVVRKLLQAGYEVAEAENGQAAWELFQKEPVPMVVTDWMMPNMDGPTLISKIREANLPAYTYIIILTALAERQNVVKGEKVGTDDYLTKPVDAEELLARAALGERILRMKARQQEAKKK